MSNDSDSPPELNEALEPIRARVTIAAGVLVEREGVIYRISQVLNFDSVIAIAVESGRSTPLRIGELCPVTAAKDEKAAAAVDLAEIEDEGWRIAQQRYAAINPLLGFLHVGREEIATRAKAVGVNPATLYRWLQRYRASEVITALVPQKRGWRPGRHRLPVKAEVIVEKVLREFYLTPQRPTAEKTVLEVFRQCDELGVTPPGASTVRARIARLEEKDRLRGRGYKDLARSKFLPAAGSFPNADFPLSVVQIDHTRADIVLVDDFTRQPIERPWITVAIDVFSRMVVGYYLSFDAPSETAVGMCIAHSMLPKEEWLMLHQVEANWPVWGYPKTIHVDNGPDFRSNGVLQSCLAYGIGLEFRPVKRPQYGGHIERLLGTLLREIHTLPGTTFSSVPDRAGYDSEKRAAMTLGEFERWFVTLICKMYHARLHTGLGMTPLKKWEIGVFGNAAVQGVGVPALPANRMTVMLDFLPRFRRTVQPIGVTIDGMTYYAESLRPWINATEPDSAKKRSFIFRRDPRDMSAVWFYDPSIKQYFKVPSADLTLPAMSLWEYQRATKKMKHEGHASVNKGQLLRTITELRTQVEGAKQKTKKARREAQRRRVRERKVNPATPLVAAPGPASSIPPAALGASNLLVGDIDDAVEIA